MPHGTWFVRPSRHQRFQQFVVQPKGVCYHIELLQHSIGGQRVRVVQVLEQSGRNATV